MVKLSFVVTFLVVSGITSGVVITTLYVLANIGRAESVELVLALIVAPLFHTVILTISGIVGYPVYRKLASAGGS